MLDARRICAAGTIPSLKSVGTPYGLGCGQTDPLDLSPGGPGLLTSSDSSVSLAAALMTDDSTPVAEAAADTIRAHRPAAGRRLDGAARLRHRRGRLRGRPLRSGQDDRRHAAAGDLRGADPAAAGDLPLAARRARAAARRRHRLRRRRRPHLHARRGGRDHRERPDHGDPDRADVRRRHRLLPADRRPLPRRAAAHAGRRRGDGGRHPAHRAGDPQRRRDRDRRDARARTRRLQRHPRDGADPRAGRRRDGRRGADAAARDPRDARPPLVLAGGPRGRGRGRAASARSGPVSGAWSARTRRPPRRASR